MPRYSVQHLPVFSLVFLLTPVNKIRLFSGLISICPMPASWKTAALKTSCQKESHLHLPGYTATWGTCGNGIEPGPEPEMLKKVWRE
ncbi:MAG: hypothetical protein SCH71_07355 [Desulfobulbaceae bacterium]|nr:hypothetical protein [Desulfobulbaceae bacterium]